MKGAFRIHGPDGLLSVIPIVIGFHPADSLVLACLQGERQLLRPVVRVDLTDYWKDAENLADRMALAALQHADRAILVFYGLEVDPLHFDDLLRERGLVVLDTVFTDNAPHELDPEIAAENVGIGRVVETGRQSLRARVEFNPQADGHTNLVLVTAMFTSTSRDEYLAVNLPRAAEALREVLTVCRRVRDPVPGASTLEVTMAANLCVVAGILAYRLGDGALTRVCLDRSLRIYPAHPMSHLMIGAMSMAIRPDELDVLCGVTPEPD